MTCPRCGLPIEPGTVAWCPRCGQPLQAPSASMTSEAPAQAPGAPPNASGGVSVPLYPVYPAPLPPPPQAAPGGNEPGQYPAYPVYPPGYGAPAPPSYGLGYGPPAPPAYGSGYAAGYGAPPWAPPSMLPPQPPPRKRTSALVVTSVVALAVVLLVVAIAGGSALVLRQRGIGQVPAQPAATATATPIMPGMNGRTPLVDDPLMSDAPDWPNVTNCFVRSDGYHITDDYFCYPNSTSVSDATISVQAKLITGTPDVPYGLAFRISNQPHQFAFYFFGVYTAGDWTFQRDDNGTWTSIVDPQPSAAIQGGLQSVTTLTVNATGSHFVFYIGRTQVGTADDSALTQGHAGLTIAGRGEAVFTNFIVAN
ncbi:MAG TPA: hypothetical protein VF116_17435 [Ktedonobacterales bacterium]